MARDERTFDCQAYGPKFPHCFHELVGECESRSQCELRMAQARAALRARAKQLLEHGNSLEREMARVVLEIPLDELLNGDAEPE